ncbi:MAG: glycosyltransferase [Candidatus Yanofskybacteria bacterium]|nr:glycosyltransferase [Candidatus Yanofskybacteria bacterium]
MAKLLMITGDRSLAQGKQGAFYNTLEEFHKHWERIDVICPRAADQNTRELFGNVFIHASPSSLVGQPRFINRKGQELFKQHAFDLITVHDYPPFYNGLGGWLLHRTINVPYVLEIMHIPGYPRAGNLKELLYRWLIKWFIRVDAHAAIKVRVINQQQTPDFLKRAGIPASKIEYISAFYINLEIFRPLELEKRFDCLFAGRLVANKGIFIFLEALEKLPDITGCIVGDGPARSEIEHYLIHHNLSSRIQLHGWAKDHKEIARLMNESRVLVMPSFNEGGPRVVLEAMACGIPVLATPVGIVPDVLQDGISGFQIPWDSSAIAGRIKQLLDNSELLDKFRSTGLDAAQQFERVRAIQQYADRLKSFIS